MRNKQIQQKIKLKVRLGLTLTAKEKAIYVLNSKKLDLEVVRCNQMMK